MKNLSLSLFVLFVTVGLFTSCQKDSLENTDNLTNTVTTTSEGALQLGAAEGDALMAEVAEIEANAALTTKINVALENGNELQFFKTGEEATDDDMVVIEVQKCTSCSTSAIELMSKLGKKDVTVRDIYWAYSEPGTSVPVEMQGQAKTIAESNIAVQGWARSELTRANNTNSANSRSQIACDNSSFRSSIAGGFLDFVTFVRYDRKPIYNGFPEDCLKPSGFSQCIGGDRYRYKAWWNNVKKWAGKVCTKSVQTSYNDHFVQWCGGSCSADPDCNSSYYCETYYGPRISFEVKKNGNWQALKDGNKTAVYMIPPNETWTYSWYSRSSYKRDYRVNVRHAKGYDEFDFMMDAE